MWDLGFPTDAIDVVCDLYTHATTKVKWGPDYTDAIPVDRGSIQGDSLSPFLFLIYIESRSYDGSTLGAGATCTDASHRRRWTRG
jgi:hypothetical protein